MLSKKRVKANLPKKVLSVAYATCFALSGTVAFADYASWQSSSFPGQAGNYAVIHQEADPDADAVGNLYEYVFATDPNVSDAASSTITYSTVSDHPAITFRRLKGMTDYAVVLQTSPDNVNWTTIPPQVEATVDNGTYETLTWSDPNILMSVVGTHHLRIAVLPTSGITQSLFAPENVRLKLLTSTTAQLDWEEMSPAETGYVIERRSTDTGSWVVQTTTAANVNTWTDPAVPAASNVYYRLRARNATPVYSPYSRKVLLINPGDSDGDGISDTAETTAGLNPYDWSDATGDLDGDGVPNLWEQALGTSMTNGAARPAATIVVDPTFVSETATQKKTISAAITAAPGNTTTPPFSIIEVRAGVYTENVNLPSNKRILLLAAASGGGIPELRGSTTTSVVSIYGESVVDGFRITRPASSAGRGILIDQTNSDRSLVRATNCIIHGHTTGDGGGGVFFSDGRAVISHCTIADNSSGYFGNAIGLGTAGELRVLNSILWNQGGNADEEIEKSTNLVFGIGNLVYDGSISGSLLEDPLLAGTSALTSASPARAQGLSGAGSPKDINRESRPGTPDIGADQYVDSDSDGLLDWWELKYFGNLAQTPAGNSDSDGLTHQQEHDYGTNPLVADSDGDGANDGAEVTAGSNPLDSDTDDDLIPDGYEITYGLNPLDVRDDLEDKDGDRIPNYYEYVRGTNPASAASVPATDYTVNPAGGGTHTTIAAAVTDAKSAAGDCKIILVKRAVYATSGITLDTKRILLLGEQGAYPPEIVSQDTNSCVRLNYNGAVADGLVLRNQSFLNDAKGVTVNTATLTNHVKITNCVITGNYSNFGGGVSITKGFLTVDHCTIFGNGNAYTSTTSPTGIGIGVYVDGRLRLRNSIVWNPNAHPATSQIWKQSSSASEVTVSNSIVLGGEFSASSADPLLDRYGCLRPGSPGINPAGGGVLNPAKDIHGETRSSPADWGADEYIDSDGDGLPDSWEIRFYGNLASNGSSNADADGLTAAQEYAFGSNPTVADTDADGLNDGGEQTAGTDPWDTDSDDDTITDSYEVSKALNPLNYQDALEDKDGDRIPNLYEFIRATDANSAASKPAADYTVNPAGGGTHTTITAAITAAKAGVNDCRIILVKPGTYTEAMLDLSEKRILLMGEQGTSAPVISSSLVATCVIAKASGVVIDGLVFTHNVQYFQGWNGVHVDAPGYRSQVRVVNCIIRENPNAFGGLVLAGGELLVDHCTIFNNRGSETSGEGGTCRGIYVADDGYLRLRNSIVWNPATSSSIPQIQVVSGGQCSVSHSIVLGGEYGGTNINPELSPAGELVSGSPAINPALTPSILVSKDIHGETRDNPPDLGADEFFDTDTDTLPDHWELKYFGNLSKTAANDNDTPTPDGLENWLEWYLGFDPTKSDTDTDGLSDLIEATALAGKLPEEEFDWLQDEDGDGLTLFEELALGTRPRTADTNGDGYLDGFGSAFISPTTLDHDGDGLTNSAEILAGTNPFKADTDGDGYADNIDAFPLNATMHTNPVANPADTTSPVITILEPGDAVKLP